MLFENKKCNLLLVLLLGACMLLGACGKKGDSENPEVPEISVVEGAQAEENELLENDHASVDRLVRKYLDCMVTGDVEALEVVVDELNEEDRGKLSSRSTLYKGYDNLQCYVKDGPEDDSYIAYLCYDLIFLESTGVKTNVPDIQCIYITPKDADGNRYIRYSNVENDEELQAYVVELEKDPNVIALYEDVKVRYQEALQQDEALYNLIQGLVDKSFESEEEVTEESQEEPEENVLEEPQEEEATEATAQNRETRVTDSVNVRKEPSTDAERLALAYQGDRITQIESYDNGWSKVEYKGLTGYVKTEYIE